MYISFKDLAIEQKQSLEYKVEKAIEAIGAGFSVCQSRSAIAFSGGKDSTVLWHLIRTHFPKEAENMAIIFGNTGVEYPESLKFARKLGKEWGGENFHEATPARLKHDELKYAAQVRVLEYLIDQGRIGEVLKPDGKLKTTRTLEKNCPPEMWKQFEAEGLIWKKDTIKSYWWCVDQYGYPILGKAASKLKARRINIDCFLRFSQSLTKDADLIKYYDVLRKAKISQACCDILKKEPSERIQADLKVDVIFKGLMAVESRSRKTNFCTRGYLFKSSRKYINVPFYHCNPLSIWTDNDIWEYINKYDVPYSPLYNLEYEDITGKKCKMQRNGCIGCFTDYGRKNSHMFVLRQTHPSRWEAVMKYGMAAEIQRLRSTDQYRPNRKDYYRLAVLYVLGDLDGEIYDERIKLLIGHKPCAFD